MLTPHISLLNEENYIHCIRKQIDFENLDVDNFVHVSFYKIVVEVKCSTVILFGFILHV